MKKLKLTKWVVHHGENGNTEVEVDVIETLPNGISRRLNSYTVPLEGTFQDGRDRDGMALAVKEALEAAGAI